jgi:hypothetical protein
MKQNPIFTLLLMLALTGCTHTPNSASLPSDWKFCYRQMDEDAIFLAGASAKDCGFVSLKSNATQRRQSKKCALASIKENLSFRVGFQNIGTDSGYCEVAIKHPEKPWIILETDYDQSGGINTGDGPILSVIECDRVEFISDSTQLFGRASCRDSVGIYKTLPSVRP